MGKPKRNEPCPCGSGKKYKKCCGTSNVIELSSVVYNEDLDRLHDDFIEFVTAHYHEEIAQKATPHVPPFSFLQDEEIAEEYLAGITLWILFNQPINNQGKTVIDMYVEQLPMQQLRTRVKNIFSEWQTASLSVYEIIRIDNNMVTIRDVMTNEQYRIPNNAYLIEDTIVIGVLVPYVGYHQFCFSFMELFSVHRDPVINTLQQYPFSPGRLEGDDVPAFLEDVLSLELDLEETDVLEWDNPFHEMVAQLFSHHMREQQYGDGIIAAGVMLWHQHCVKEYPMIKKIANYAAALEYLVLTEFFEDNPITQKQLAERYGITAGTISTNYRKLAMSVEEDIMAMEMELDEDSEDYDENLPDIPPTFNMEREMRDIQRLMEGQNFETDKEMQTFLNEVLNDDSMEQQVPMSPRDQAQEWLFDARDASGNKRKQLIQKALDTYPNSPDAYLLMAEDAQTVGEYKRYVQKAVEVGKKDLGKAFFMENLGHFWGLIETRPYMRAKAIYAEILNQSGKYEEAINEYEEMLRLNPNDNQGNRYLLLTIYMETEMYNKAKQLMDDYEENTTEFLFNKVLLYYATEGLTKTTKRLIEEAQAQNPYVTPYLIRKEKIPNTEIEYIGLGDENEAIAYVQQHIHLWVKHPELLQQL